MVLEMNKVFDLYQLNYITPNYDYLDAFCVDEYITKYDAIFNQPPPDTPFYRSDKYIKRRKSVGAVIDDIHLRLSSDVIINYFIELCDVVQINITESKLIMRYDDAKFKIEATAIINYT